MVTETPQSLRPNALAERFRPGRLRFGFGRLEWVFLLLVLVAAAMRLWELNGRTMHYDEAIHLHFAWKLAQGIEFVHSPWMHGPLQIEMVALVLKFLGDTDFLARLPYALFGVALVGIPYFLRGLIGEKGAVCAAIILAFSPSLLYFSRFGRNDVLMAVWAVLLLIMLWRYSISSERRYLFGAALVTALMLATKETAYFLILFMGVAALALGWRQILDFVRRRQKLSALDGPAGFFAFLATLTLPHAAALIAFVQSPFGLTFAAHETGSTGATGAPVWEAPFVILPLWVAPVWLHVCAALALVGVALAVARALWRLRGVVDLASVAVSVLSTLAAVSVVVAGPFQALFIGQDGSSVGFAGAYVDCGVGLGLMLLSVAILRLNLSARIGWRGVALLLGPSILLTWLWIAGFWGGADFIGQLLPDAAPAEDLELGRIAVNYLVPVLALLALTSLGAAVGVAWGGGLWLACAGVFYAVWALLYTTLFTNWPGVFTGSWQSLGYWLMQQDVARGNQPWYYYFVGLSVYELLALAFGLVAVVWLIRRREPFGIVLAAWAIATLAIYTIAAEKMPWLLVNITVPLALVAGMFLGHLMDRLSWPLSREERWRVALPLVMAPAWVVLAVWVAWLAIRGDAVHLAAWLTALTLFPIAVVIALLLRVQPHAGKSAAFGIAGLLLLFGVVGAWRAAYTYDDSNPEILAYAQGSADLNGTHAYLLENALIDGGATGAVKVDYDMWYPFQWYVREETRLGALQFDRFCASSDKDGSEGCQRVANDAGPKVYLAEHAHAVDEDDAGEYNREGPMRNLLWYPETYRRPGEARIDTHILQQLTSDVSFFRDTAADPKKLKAALEYLVARHQESDWFSAEYYQYTRD